MKDECIAIINRCLRYEVYYTLMPTGGLSYAVWADGTYDGEAFIATVDVPETMITEKQRFILNQMQRMFATKQNIILIHGMGYKKAVQRLFYMTNDKFYTTCDSKSLDLL